MSSAPMTTTAVNRHTEEKSFPKQSIEYEYVWMKETLFHVILVLDGLVFLFCICCAIAIIFYRKHLTFVNTGFALIYVFILGCVMMLLSVPLFGIDSNLTNKLDIPKTCMVRVWLLSVGYSLSVGIMIVRIIYTAFMEVVRDFKSYRITSSIIVFFVLSMAAMDTIIVIAWRWFSPPHKDYVTKETELIGLQDERRTLVETCNSSKESVLIFFFCFYKGGLLVAALIISLFKGEDEDKRSEDYKQCRIGLLSVLIAAAIGLPVVLSLPYEPNKSFALGGVVVLLEVVFLMTWLKASKIFSAYKCRKGETLEFGKYSVERSPRYVPCVRPVYGCVNTDSRQGLYNESFVTDFGSAYEMKDSDPESVKETDKDDNFKDSGIGFDCKVSEDILPSDFLPLQDDYNLKPYDPDAAADEEQNSDDEATDGKAEGGTSDDDSSSSSSSDDDEDAKEDVSSSSRAALARSAVSVHLRTPGGSQTLCAENHQEEQTDGGTELSEEATTKSASSERKGWWKPMFGRRKKEGKKTIPNSQAGPGDDENKEDDSTSNAAFEDDSGEESEDSDSRSEATRRRCVTPHGGSASDSDSDTSDESQSD